MENGNADMTITESLRLRISLVTLLLMMAGALCADRVLAQALDLVDASFCYQDAPNFPSTCVPMTFNANVQLTKLHPAVLNAALGCRVTPPPGVNPNTLSENRGSPQPVTGRAFSGLLTTTMRVPVSRLVDPANRTMSITCRVLLTKSGGQTAAVPSATQAESITDSNWAVVAAGSTVSWTQTVTIPNATP
jgi:hypothetical protein